MEQWLYENLIVVLLAGFSGFEIVRRGLQIAWTSEIPKRGLQLIAAALATQFIGSKFTDGKFAKEQVSAWPEAYATDDLPMDIEFDRKSELKFDLPTSLPVAPLRLCSGDCSGL